MRIWDAVFGKRGNEKGPLYEQQILPRNEQQYALPPCRTLEDLVRLVIDEPTEAELRGFRACLEALQFEPAAFLDVAFHIQGGWSAYHALHEIRQLCCPQARKLASIVLHALSVRRQ